MGIQREVRTSRPLSRSRTSGEATFEFGGARRSKRGKVALMCLRAELLMRATTRTSCPLAESASMSRRFDLSPPPCEG